MGNNSFDKKNLKKYNSEKDISLKINLKKVCYFPGDSVRGTFSLESKSKTEGKSFFLANPQATVSLTQKEYYHYHAEGGETMYEANVVNDTPISILPLGNSEFIGQEISKSKSVSIPFKIKIPLNILPSSIFDGNYCIHLLSAEFPGIQAKRTIIIIIKTMQIFNTKNKLYKSPSIITEDIIKKANKTFKGGEVFVSLETPKNAFNYYDSIPFQINIDCSRIEIEISFVKVSITRKTHLKRKTDKKKIESKSCDIICKEIKIDQKKNVYNINDSLKFPMSSQYNSVFPPNVYSFLEGCKIIELNFDLNKVSLYPHSLDGLINIEYYLVLEIIYKPSTINKDTLTLPLDFYLVESPQEEKKPIEQHSLSQNDINYKEKIKKIDNNELIDIFNKFEFSEDEIENININGVKDDNDINNQPLLDFNEEFPIESCRRLVDIRDSKRKKSWQEKKIIKP